MFGLYLQEHLPTKLMHLENEEASLVSRVIISCEKSSYTILSLVVNLAVKLYNKILSHFLFGNAGKRLRNFGTNFK